MSEVIRKLHVLAFRKTFLIERIDLRTIRTRLRINQARVIVFIEFLFRFSVDLESTGTGLSCANNPVPANIIKLKI